MTDPEDREEEAATLLAGAAPLQAAREYLANARAIGEPGSPSMIDAAELQSAHALMAQAAAFVSIAESLHRLAVLAPGGARRMTRVAKALETVAKEDTAMRYLMRRGR